MSQSLRISGVTLWLALLATPCQAAFEGSMSISYYAEAHTVLFKYLVKGHKIRLDIENSVSVLVDLDAHTQTILFPQTKSYVVHAGDVPQSESNNRPSVTDTKKTEIIAGHICEDYRIEDKNYFGTSCMSRDFGDSQIDGVIGGRLGDRVGALSSIRTAGIPLKYTLTYRNPALGESSSMEVVKVVPGSVSDTQFEVPEGWLQIEANAASSG